MLTRADQQTVLLTELRREWSLLLGGQFSAAYLYGSRARGEHRPDSDVDVLVVVRGEADCGALIERTSEAVSRLSLKYDTVISRVFVSNDRFEHERSPFRLNVRREGTLI
jgi:predicted nucleotidyltransferase